MNRARCGARRAWRHRRSPYRCGDRRRAGRGRRRAARRRARAPRCPRARACWLAAPTAVVRTPTGWWRSDRRPVAGHRAHRPHAAVALVAAALDQLHLAGALLGAGEQRSDHDGRGAGGDRLDDVARVRDAAVGDDRDAELLRPPGGEPDGRELWHAGAATPRASCRSSRADADLDGVGARVGERLDAFFGDHVAGDDRRGSASSP